MKKVVGLFVALCWMLCAAGQDNGASVQVQIVDAANAPLSNVTAELLRRDSVLVKIQVTDAAGKTLFSNLAAGDYFCRISRVGFATNTTKIFSLASDSALQLAAITLQPGNTTMQGITVTARKPFIELQPGKTVVNLDAGIANVGTTAMEALERMPGITIDRDGNIALKGRTGVMVMIDGKPTYLSASELATMLNGMSSAQIEQVEIMDNPPARFDAAGNAGVINIKMKKNRQKGFNGSLTTAFSQGFYPKNNNSLQLNYRSGKWNFFLNYASNFNQGFTRIYALRSYFDEDEKTVLSLLEQPSFLRGNGNTHSVRTGFDYTLSKNTSIGIGLTGLALERRSNGKNAALWMDAEGATDSLIQTASRNNTAWQNAGANVNVRHSFSANRGLSADVDVIGYRIRGDQFFENISVTPPHYTEASRADIPSDIAIYSAKADYTEQKGDWKLEGGVKSSYIKTDNLVAYEYMEGTAWKPDLGKTNHFLYNETIHAVYGSSELKKNKWTAQGGLRYENTAYDARQLGNAMVKDSSFSRSYDGLFPSMLLSLAADSAHTFSISAGRRIDRPAFQKLNPFLYIINKYTYQQGNPFYRPQYTWNMEFSHIFKEKLVTGLSYSTTKDYFSQIFPIDSNGIVLYTEGNLGRLQNWGLSVSLQQAPFTWWSFSAQAVLNYKKLEGFVERAYKANITQVSINLSNQFRFAKDWTGELSGFYTSRSQHDIQEVVDPAGQLSIGISKMVLKGNGTIKFSMRDIFYTQWMKGLTQFTRATEYFKLTRDSRIATIAFTWRFGKAFKAARRSDGAAGEEMERVGNG